MPASTPEGLTPVQLEDVTAFFVSVDNALDNLDANDNLPTVPPAEFSATLVLAGQTWTMTRDDGSLLIEHG